MNASIGQGFVQVTPLQMATLYALIANGGTLVTPHLADTIEDPGGDVVKELRFKARRKVDVDPFVLETIRSGLRGVTHDVSGTAAHAFAGFPVGVAGKTGTAQKPPLDDFAWFAGYAPVEDPQLVAVAVIEQGGFGGVGAAAAVREAFTAAFNARPASCRPATAEEAGREGRVADHQRPAARRSRSARHDGRRVDRMTAAIFFRRLDYVLLAAIAGVIAFGSVTILSVTGAETERRHLAYVAIGVVLALAVATVDLRLYRKILWPGYVALLLLLMLVLGLEAARGSSRWITLPGFNLQPSEIGKVIVIVVLAALVAEHSRDKQGTWRTFGLSLLVMAIPGALVFLEPDLGTAIVYGAAWLAILFVAGARLLQIAAVLAVVVGGVLLVFDVLPATGVRLLQPYQQARLTAFLDPQGSSEAAYQAQQSKIAIGSGGLSGKGSHGATARSRASCRSAIPTSSSPWWASSAGSWGRHSCWRCTS